MCCSGTGLASPHASPAQHKVAFLICDMEKQPRQYSLPEAFVKDPSVPIRWRVWAIINGFFINGQYCWASNEYLALQLKVHKDSVSQAIKELEEMEIVRCTRGARSRYIYPMIGANAYQWSASAPISDRRQRLSISVSNSERETSVTYVPRVYSVEKEPDTKKERTSSAKYPHAKTVFSWFPFPEKSWQLNVTECKHAELLWERGEKNVKGALKFAYQHKDDDFFTYHPVWKPSQLERNWVDLTQYKP